MPRAAKSMPWPGTTCCIADSMSARLSWPCARSASTACSWVTPAGSWRAEHAGEDQVGGVAEDLRADHAERRRWRRRAPATATRCDRSGASSRSSRFADGPKSSDFSAGIPTCRCGGPPRRGGCRPAARLRGRRRPRSRARSCRLLHGLLATRRSRRRSGRSRAARRASRCPRRAPSSSTTIWSASRMRRHPLGDDDHGRVAR